MSNEADDVAVENHGTLWRFRLLTETAIEWAGDNVDIPDYMYSGRSFACEHRFGPDIVEEMRNAGLKVIGG